MARFIVQRRLNGEFQFNLQASNGKIILTSEGYSTIAKCRKGIQAARKNAIDDRRYKRKTLSNGKFHFNLTSVNGQVIGSAQTYNSRAAMEKGIASVRANAPGAEVSRQ